MPRPHPAHTPKEVSNPYARSDAEGEPLAGASSGGLVRSEELAERLDFLEFFLNFPLPGTEEPAHFPVQGEQLRDGALFVFAETVRNLEVSQEFLTLSLESFDAGEVPAPQQLALPGCGLEDFLKALRAVHEGKTLFRQTRIETGFLSRSPPTERRFPASRAPPNLV